MSEEIDYGFKINMLLASQQNERLLFNRQYLQKFELYLASLTFTILGLSIQTGNFQKDTIGNVFELTSWLFFLLSGIIALFKLKKFQSHFQKQDDYFGPEIQPPDEKSAKEFLSEQKRIKRMTNLQWGFLILGFICLICSRGYEPFTKIIGFR